MINYVFKRYELKYCLSWEQYQAVQEEIKKQLSPDEFGETTIQSLYYDTDDFRLVRASIEKPIYKEKLRLRCYGLNDSNKDVYLEMKRKYDGVVYKRRISCKENEVQNILNDPALPSQIGRELGYFNASYQNLSPKILILYDRSAYFDRESDLRVTFDKNIRYRTESLDFSTSLEGRPLLPQGSVLMELKTGTAFPLWLCDLLSREKLFKTSFSKYGNAYLQEYNKHLLRSKIVCLNPLFLTEPSVQRAFS